MSGTIATIGMFDGVHRGHKSMLQSLSGNHPPLVFTFANHPLSVINPDLAPKLLTTPNEKSRLLQSLGMQVVMLNFDNDIRSLTAEEFMCRLRDNHSVSTLVLGFNNRFGSDRHLSFDDYVAIGHRLSVNVRRAPEFLHNDKHTVSSSAIRRALAEGRVDFAAELLGRPYSIAGIVEHGNRVGHSIGFPTANIGSIDHNKIQPLNGVYAVDALLPDGLIKRAIVNIGNRPTLNDGRESTIEAHIIDYDADLYGLPIEIRFLRRLRDEKRFPSLDALAAQLTADRLKALSL